MKRLFGLVFVVAACGNSSSPAKTDEPQVDAAYKADIDALCNVLERSGAIELEGHDRALKSATWLGPNIKTDAARKFLGKLRSIKDDTKGDVLDAEAIRVGLPGCPLSVEWRKPKAGSNG